MPQLKLFLAGLPNVQALGRHSSSGSDEERQYRSFQASDNMMVGWYLHSSSFHLYINAASGSAGYAGIETTFKHGCSTFKAGSNLRKRQRQPELWEKSTSAVFCSLKELVLATSISNCWNTAKRFACPFSNVCIWKTNMCFVLQCCFGWLWWLEGSNFIASRTLVAFKFLRTVFVFWECSECTVRLLSNF